ncbi:SatD family protein [Planococcus sp. APC 4015]|nr:SatD family protein [Planococcus sp. APC 4015]
MVAAVIADIVASRELDDRPAAQRELEQTLAQIAEVAPAALSPLMPTVGDELQGVYPDLAAALVTTMLLQLALPAGIELRFGIGLGEIHDIPSARGPLSEGAAWWAARSAIEQVEQLARRAAPTARTRVAATDAGPHDLELVRVANSGLLARDRAVAQLSPRTRRIVYGRWLGRTQKEIAASEGVVQSAVSQALATSDGGAVIEGLRALADPLH